MPDLSNLGLVLSIPLFIVAAVAVWLSGVRLTHYANAISEKTGMGQALAGILLLGGVTSLPELAVSVTSTLSGDVVLAVNGILGGIAMQVAILAFADALIRRKALTAVVPDAGVILQGVLTLVVLNIAAASVMVGDRPVLGVGLWMWLLLALTGVSFWILSQYRAKRPWIVQDPSGELSMEKEGRRAKHEAKEVADQPLSRVLWQGAIAAAIIICSGYVLSRTGDAIAHQTGLGQSFAGAVLLAVATSLPEMSTVTTAVRAGLYTMAVSDIFGTNLFDLGLLFLIDVLDGAGAAMNEVGSFSGFAALVGTMVTAIFIAGLAERRERMVLRMGYDSTAVIVTYLGGLVVLYFLR